MAIENTYLLGKNITLGCGFDLQANAPLDSRQTVPAFAGLQALINGNAAYEGMIVYDEETKKTYQAQLVDDVLSFREFGINEAELKDLIASETTAAMEFKGAANALPENPAKGDMYKVTTTFKVGEEDAKVGDSIVYDGEQWFIIPSGDDIEDTWRPVTGVDNNSTLTFTAGDKLEKTVAADGTITYKHEAIDAPTNMNAEGDEQTRTYITQLITDNHGHVIGFKTATENVEDTNTTYEFEGQSDEATSVYFQVKGSDAEAAEVIYLNTYSKNDADQALADAIAEVEQAIEDKDVIIDVVALPTEGIKDSALYRLTTASFVENQWKNNYWECIVVNALGDVTNPIGVVDNPAAENPKITAYYDLETKAAYGYYNGGMIPLETIAPAFGLTYEGVTTDITSLPTEADGHVGVLVEYNLYDHKDGKWNTVKQIGWHGTGNGAEIFNTPSNIASGIASHAEGYLTEATGNFAHAEGLGAKAIGRAAHAEGTDTLAQGDASHVEGTRSKSFGNESHAEGYETTTNSHFTHAEGYQTFAGYDENYNYGDDDTHRGEYAHAEGERTRAINYSTHAEGKRTLAAGTASHAGGESSEATGLRSFTHGWCTKAKETDQFVVGAFNADDPNALFVVGNGRDESNRNNAFVVDRNGKAYVNGNQVATKADATYTAGNNITITNNQINLNSTLNGITRIDAGQDGQINLLSRYGVYLGGESAYIGVDQHDIRIGHFESDSSKIKINGNVEINDKPVHAIATSGKAEDLEGLDEILDTVKEEAANQTVVALAEAQKYTDALSVKVYTKDEVDALIATAHTWGEF